MFPHIAAYTAKPSNTRPDLDAMLLTGVPAGLFPGFQNYTGATKADLLRLNVAIAPTSPASANILGVIGGDNAGFPNGRRVFDDVVSVELKAVAGALLHDVVPSFTPDPAAAALFAVSGPATEPTTIADLASAGLSFPAHSPTSATRGTAMTTPPSRTSRFPADGTAMSTPRTQPMHRTSTPTLTTALIPTSTTAKSRRPGTHPGRPARAGPSSWTSGNTPEPLY